MDRKNLELKVGAFVFLCLLALGVMLLRFSKGTTLFMPTYTVYLKTGNVGGLRTRASVLMSGVQVGTVSQTVLSPEGTNVTIGLTIYKQYIIHRSARFVIEQAGFLGDQYVAIYPEGNLGPVLQPGDEASVAEPFNLQEVARSAQGFIQRVDVAAQKLNDAISDVRRLVLNEQTLTNLSITVATLRQTSEDARTTVGNINQLVVTNRAAAATAVSNLVTFTEQLKTVASCAQDVVTTNVPQIDAAVSNVLQSTAILTNLLGEVQAGHGLAGTVLKNEQLASDISVLASNLALTSRALNEQGLWRVVFGPRHSSTNQPAAPLHVQGRGTLP